MFNYKVRYCKSRMVAFINGELPLKSRRRVARYIDECEECYAEYIRQKQLVRDLEYKLPVIGEPSDSQMDKMWAGIQASLQANTRPKRRTYHTRYGILTLAFVLAVIVPFTLGNGLPTTVASAATQPAPENESIAETTVAPFDYAQPIAMATVTANYQNRVQETEVIEKVQVEPHLTPGIMLIPGER